MSDNLIFGDAYLLSGLDVTMAAGGYQDEQLGEGAGPTDAEATIEAIFLNYNSPAIDGDSWSSYHQNRAEFHDLDQNGYYDVLRRTDDDGTWSFNADTGTWSHRAFTDNKITDSQEK